MYNYPLQDIRGRNIGLVTLNSEDIPKILMDGGDFRVGVSYKAEPTKKVQAIMFVPAVAYPQSDLETALVYLWRIRMEAETTTINDDPNAFAQQVNMLANFGMGKNRQLAQELSAKRRS